MRARFWISEPYGIDGREIRLEADADVMAYAATLDELAYLYSFGERMAIADLSALYDRDEAWLRVYYALDAFVQTQNADLSLWARALNEGSE